MDVKIRVCLLCKYGRFMLFIDNNLLLSSARLRTENDNNFGYEKIMIVVDNIPLNYDDLTVYSSGVLSLMKNDKMYKRKKAITDYFMQSKKLNKGLHILNNIYRK
jgi:hypothetical protein